MAMSGYAGLKKIPFHDIFQPSPGVLFITDTQTVNSWTRSWAQEGTIFYDSAANHVKIYFTGGSDSLASTAFNNKVGYVTTTDFITYSGPYKAFGQGAGGGPLTVRASASWVGKIGTRYFALALNGYSTNYSQDRNIYGYTSSDGANWTYQGIKVNKATAWSGGALNGFGNIGVCTTPANTPVVIGGKYQALIEVHNGSTWVMYRGEADSLMGSWTLTNALTTLNVGNIPSASSAQLIYHNGVYHAFYHATSTGGVSKPYYARSNDCITWVPNVIPFLGAEATPYGVQTDQFCADPNVAEISGRLYLVGGYIRNAAPFAGQIRIWSYNGTFQQFLNQVAY